MKKLKDFPAKIFVRTEEPGDGTDAYLLVDRTIGEGAVIGEKINVAIYGLLEVREVSGIVAERVIRKAPKVG